jgi:hypothetical protein
MEEEPAIHKNHKESMQVDEVSVNPAPYAQQSADRVVLLD